MVDLAKACIKASGALFAFYYLRVTQADGHMAWSSPIWVDCVPRPPKKAIVKPPVKGKDARSTKKPLPSFDEKDEEDIEDEEEDF